MVLHVLMKVYTFVDILLRIIAFKQTAEGQKQFLFPDIVVGDTCTLNQKNRCAQRESVRVFMSNNMHTSIRAYDAVFWKGKRRANTHVCDMLCKGEEFTLFDTHTHGRDCIQSACIYTYIYDLGRSSAIYTRQCGICLESLPGLMTFTNIYTHPHTHDLARLR